MIKVVCSTVVVAVSLSGCYQLLKGATGNGFGPDAPRPSYEQVHQDYMDAYRKVVKNEVDEAFARAKAQCDYQVALATVAAGESLDSRRSDLTSTCMRAQGW
jgi:hypothetical protein